MRFRWRSVAKPSRNGRSAKLLLAVAGLTVGGLLIEVGSYGYLLLAPPREQVGRWEFRSTRPAPYRDADYFSADFLAESMRSVRLEEQPDTGLLFPGDYTGLSIHVSEGRRRTTDQPTTTLNRVLLFGGSTIFSSEVPDEWTVASCLQRRLNRTVGPQWKVENYGTSSIIAAQQTQRLFRCDLQPGDVVIFYDGVNDVYYPIYNGMAEGWRPGKGHDGGVRKLSGTQRRLYPWCLKAKDISAAARLLFRQLDGPRPRNVTHAKLLEEHLEAAEIGYREALVAANAFAAGKRARFVHFLQPNAFTLCDSTSYEIEILRNELRGLPGLDTAYALGYPRLRVAIAAASAAGVISHDLSTAFDGPRAGQEYYLDFCHVAHAANEKIAETLFDRAFARTSP